MSLWLLHISLSLHVQVNVSADGVVEKMETFRCRLTVPADETGVIISEAVTTVIIEDSERERSVGIAGEGEGS